MNITSPPNHSLKKFDKFVLLLILIFSFLYNTLNAQEKSDNEYYFNDGDVSLKKNIVKINLLPIILGELTFQYEHIFSDEFSVEIGTGLVLNNYTPFVPSDFKVNDNEIKIDVPGLNIKVEPRIYLSGFAPESFYIGMFYCLRQYKIIEVTIMDNTLGVNYGWQFFLGSRIAADVSLGTGIRMVHRKNVTNAEEDLQFAMPVNVKFGYLF